MKELFSDPRTQIFAIVFALGAAISIIIHDWRECVKTVYLVIMSNLARFYLCGYSLYEMIQNNFIPRFCSFNHEGFCYTFSAAAMLALKSHKKSRLVRGYIDYEDSEKSLHSYHSWVEVKILGVWWSVDLNIMAAGFTTRAIYYRKFRPRISIVYKYKEFWSDPYAEQFYQRMTERNTSYLFYNLQQRYTPVDDRVGLRIISPEAYADKGLVFFDSPHRHYVFSPECNLHCEQSIINEFMKKPTRKSPKLRTLRYVKSAKRRADREAASSAPAT